LSDLGTINLEALETLIQEVSASGGAETANTQIFIERLTKALNLPTPDFAGEQNEFNNYTFERRVDFKFPDGSTSIGRIDCYKRDCFVLEAKQSSKRKRDPRQLDMLGEDAKQKKLGTSKRGTGGWDKSMRAARKQAENYARALPVSHGYPPFLLVLDVGNVLEVYADFSGQGKNYAQFPDRNSYRLSMNDLRGADVQDRLRKIWQDPQSLNPALISAVVTRDIAERLAKIAKRLEGDYDSETVAHFLMRCLFTMFAEDVKLIEEKSFENLLLELKEKPDQFVPLVESLWKDMNDGGYSAAIRNTVRHFNGGLFANCRALPLEAEAIHELWVAAKRDWSDVEPAIFGTLLEQALDPRERGKLGAHYTPRTYVERLVIPTIIEPLRGDWEDVLAHVNDLHDDGKDDEALEAVKTFHHALCTTRVLDPACGTGNFLYVSLELMKRLEGEVLDTLDDLGLADLDLNERAVAIADLVLWLGHIKWQLRTSGLDSISDPVLEKLGNIRHQDAILAYDNKALTRDNDGNPVTRWNGYSYKAHPITGNDVPDPDARVESYDYENPKRAKWPETEFIVGNPPFIGGKDMRAELGDGYAEAVWKARPKVPGGADFVMHFWEEAAQRLSRKPTKAKANPLRRFGFITTNSITQTFSRRVVQAALSAKSPISLVYAVADHPWMKASDKAAVRIAMTVSERGESDGLLGTVIKEVGLATDTPNVLLKNKIGAIRSSIKIGANTGALRQLLSNESIAHKGFMPYGAKAFFISAHQARTFGLGSLKGAEEFIRPYRNGSDLNGKPRGIYTLDFHEKTQSFVRDNYPLAYQHLQAHSQEERAENNVAYRRDYWWRYGQPSHNMRAALLGLSDYIGTSESAKHRMFGFLSEQIAPDQKVRVIASMRRDFLSILSARIHILFSFQTGGWLGAGNDPVYQHTDTFNPFPFPVCVTDGSNPNLHDRLISLGDRLNAHRKSAMEKHDFLTMTGIYNILERVRELDAGIGEPLSDAERDVYNAALIGILKEIHDDIDCATLEAYGWSDLVPALVGKVGGTIPSPHKTPEQEAAEEELLSRLVALNIERREEERTGKVRWLRPDYQIPKLSHKVKAETKDMDVAPFIVDAAPAWPKDGLDQIKVVRELLARSEAPVLPEAVSASFKASEKPKTNKPTSFPNKERP